MEQQIHTVISQKTLFDTGKKILDATCSYKRKWPRFATVRIDVRPETKPDIVMDAKDLKFPDNYFDEIYCDPPHIIRKSTDLTNVNLHRRLIGRELSMLQRFWFWKNTDEWLDFVKKTNDEFYRCLKPKGLLYYKMTEAKGCVTIKSLIENMVAFKVVADKTRPSKTNFSKFNKVPTSQAHFLTFAPTNER